MIDFTWTSKLQTCVLIIGSFAICAKSDVPRPRGVPLAKAPLYSPTKDFTCFDGTVTIPYSYVNDDYCDCFDGSDEPGTSACLNGVFHCTNAGHRPQNLPSSRVNDGVCDCCDGTDEYASDKPTCANTCEDLGKEAKAEASRLAELYKEGSLMRQQLIERGNKKRSEMAEQLSQLEKDREEAEKIKTEKENRKNELEAKENEALQIFKTADEEEREKQAEQEKEELRKEASEVFDKYDTNQDGVLIIDEIRVINIFDKNDDGEVDENEIKYFFSDSESVDKETFITSAWVLIRPLVEHEERQDHELEQELDGDDDGDHDAEDMDIMEDASKEPESEAEQEKIRNYDAETQALVNEASDARSEHANAERAVREIESNIQTIRNNLDKDYGVHQEFATLDNQCFEYGDKEYIYRLCMFEKVTQESRNGGAQVGLGNWGQWGGDDSYTDYSVMKYTNGVTCWNGPARSTTVKIVCGLDTKLLSVSEPHRCEYHMDLSTPAACDSFDSQQHSSHDEL